MFFPTSYPVFAIFVKRVLLPVPNGAKINPISDLPSPPPVNVSKTSIPIGIVSLKFSLKLLSILSEISSEVSSSLPISEIFKKLSSI